MDYTAKVRLGPSTDFNSGLNEPSPHNMVDILGWPIKPSQMTEDCKPITSLSIKKHIITSNVGPFTATGYDVAIADLIAIFKEVKRDHPELYAMLGTAGMLCCRFIRGKAVPSNHSWGMAIDMKVNDILVPLGSPCTLQGLLVLYGYFHKYKWFSGMGYKSRKDSMHFSPSIERIREWRDKGKLN